MTRIGRLHEICMLTAFLLLISGDDSAVGMDPKSNDSKALVCDTGCDEHGKKTDAVTGPKFPTGPNSNAENSSADETSESHQPEYSSQMIQAIAKHLKAEVLLDSRNKSSIADQLRSADSIFSQAKQRNLEAIRQASRQFRFRGSESPNIVLIIADDLSFHDLECYGPSLMQAPVISDLARNGVVFTSHYSASSSNSDARWTLVTGKRPDQAREKTLTGACLSELEPTVASHLWKSGYATGVFGNWGVMNKTGPVSPNGFGYDTWAGTISQADHSQAFPDVILHNGIVRNLEVNAAGQQNQLVDDIMIAEANVFLAHHVLKRPVFLQLFLSLPGIQPPNLKNSRQLKRNLPKIVIDRAACIERVDDAIARVQLQLQELKQLSNTVFILTSDTAVTRGQLDVLHQARNQEAANGRESGAAIGLRGAQGEHYEGGLRIPLIVSGAGVPSGVQSSAISVAWDLGHTILDFTGAHSRPQLKQGQSLVPFLKQNAPLPSRLLVWRSPTNTDEFAIRWNRWKLILKSSTEIFELYDLESDSQESTNLAGKHPEVLQAIMKRLVANQ